MSLPSATLVATLTEAQGVEPRTLAMPYDHEPFVAAITRQLGTARRYGMQPAVLVISVEAHCAGDTSAIGPVEMQELMQTMREPLQRQLRRADLILRVDANRFGVLLADAPPVAVAGICARLERAAGWPGQLLGRPVRLRVCVGASGSPGGNSAWMEAGDMMRAAEEASRARLA